MNELQKQTCNAIVNIFEGTSITGNYGAVGGYDGKDNGHLSYGKSQVSLMSGNLYNLISEYCALPGAQFAEQLKPFLERIRLKDTTLDRNLALRSILARAGGDAVMKYAQDKYFDENFFEPALKAAQRVGLQQPLSQTIAYDSHIQGGWAFCSASVQKALGPIGPNVTEEAWIKQYLEVRSAYLDRTAKGTGYRTQDFSKLVAAGAWELDLPLTLQGLTIKPDSFAAPAPEPRIPPAPIPDPEIDSLPILSPRIPYLRGPDILSLQKLLNTAGLKNSEDQIYGPFTQTLVLAFQKRGQLKPDAIVGPQTWTALKAIESSAP